MAFYRIIFIAFVHTLIGDSLKIYNGDVYSLILMSAIKLLSSCNYNAVMHFLMLFYSLKKSVNCTLYFLSRTLLFCLVKNPYLPFAVRYLKK